jgi:2-methylisocitrate lyase-like PEP mutase family enzyme
MSSTMQSQNSKAEDLRSQHHSDKLLILPNIWEPLGAKLLELTGYPSIATASVSTALANGFVDGERISFAELMGVVKKISSAVHIPVTVDIERGYAKSIMELKENIRLLIESGGVGINIEDSLPDQSGFYPIEDQCKKIEAVRETGIKYGVSIVINARTDIFLFKKDENAAERAIERIKAYKKAGADCAYPILINNYEDIKRVVQAVEMPVNVNLLKPIADLEQLKKIGVARVSVGPQFLNHVLSYMKQLAEELKQLNTTTFFDRQLLSREFMNRLVEEKD